MLRYGDGHMKILIIEDDPNIRQVLKMQLEAECFAVDVAENGEQGSYLARTNEYDLVILDYVLPKKLGPDICVEIRKAGKTMPIMMLTVKSEVGTKVEALNLGADDFLVKPFSFQELLARVRALLRRPKNLTGEQIHFDDLELDTRKQSVKRGQDDIYLTRKEFMLLEYLMRHPGQVISRAELLEHIWDSSVDIFSNTIESHVVSLRKKIEKPRRKKVIHTVSGRGYKIDFKR